MTAIAPPPSIGIVNYGAGNIGNVLRAFRGLDIRHALLERPVNLCGEDLSLLLLPGVGAFRQAMGQLRATGWDEALRQWAGRGKPLLGICAGMQLLCTDSAEGGTTAGLSLLDAHVERLSGVKKIPHMGWNEVTWQNLPAGFPEERMFYFVHSDAVPASPDCIGTTEVGGVRFCSALRRKNVAGFQFHPERSGPAGVAFLGRAIAYFHKTYAAWSV